MNENEQNKKGLQLELPQEVAQGEYANFAIITHSSSDFVIDFARVLPGVPKAQVKSRVILAPEHAKRLLGALQENIIRYEKAFGPIKIPNQEPRTIAPFDLSKGEACRNLAQLPLLTSQKAKLDSKRGLKIVKSVISC